MFHKVVKSCIYGVVGYIIITLLQTSSWILKGSTSKGGQEKGGKGEKGQGKGKKGEKGEGRKGKKAERKGNEAPQLKFLATRLLKTL